MYFFHILSKNVIHNHTIIIQYLIIFTRVHTAADFIARAYLTGEV
jgi:hypothetical protein